MDLCDLFVFYFFAVSQQWNKSEQESLAMSSAPDADLKSWNECNFCYPIFRALLWISFDNFNLMRIYVNVLSDLSIS